MTTQGAGNRRTGTIRGDTRRRVRRVAFVLLGILVVEYLVLPQLIGASRNLKLIRSAGFGWVIAGTVLEGLSVLCYALLTRALLPDARPPLARLAGIVLATAAVGHVLPGGSAGGASLGFRLLTAEGVTPAAAGFTLVSQALLSAIVLNAMLWVALVVSIPAAGLHPIYVVVALAGVLLILAASALLYTFTRGENGAVRAVRAIGGRIPRLGADRLERVVRELAEAVARLRLDRRMLVRSSTWAALNWLLDAASLWMFLAAFGHRVNPVLLFAAYGIANVVAALPIVPGGLGVVEATTASLLVSFGTPRVVAAFAVLGWRLINFWLPIPVGAASYLWLTLSRPTSGRRGFGTFGRVGRGGRTARLR